jgi:hypothetical protein
MAENKNQLRLKPTKPSNCTLVTKVSLTVEHLIPFNLFNSNTFNQSVVSFARF